MTPPLNFFGEEDLLRRSNTEIMDLQIVTKYQNWNISKYAETAIMDYYIVARENLTLR